MLLFIAFAALLAFPAMASALTADSSGTTSLAPTVQSDKADYPPGATVTLSGSNWQPGESVHINVNDDEGQTWSRNVDVTADQSGNISDSFNLPDWFVATYKVTATGAQSGVATSSFTDGNVNVKANLTGTETWTLVDGARYNNNNSCSPASDRQSSTVQSNVTLTGSNQLATAFGANANQTVRLTASASSSGGGTFVNWTDPSGNPVPAWNDPGTPAVETDKKVICVSGFNGSGTNVYTANYNHAPVANNDSLTTNEDTAGTVNVLTNDTDANNDTLTVTNNTSPLHGSVTRTGGSFTYTPDANYNGSDSFDYTVSDGKGGTDTGTVNVTVTAVNDAPVAVNDSYSVNEDGTLTKDAAAGALSNDTDVDGDTLTAAKVTGSGPAHGTLTLNANGSFTYTPNANYNGSDSFDYTVSDGKGGTDTGTVNLTVTAVNDAPVAQGDTYNTNEDTTLNVTAPGVLSNDNDVEGSTLTAVLVSGPAHGSVTLNANGSFSYNPANNYNGPDSFTYKANDGNLDSNTVTVSITVTSVNDVPTCENVAIETNEDEQGSVAPDCTDVDGDSLTYQIASQGANGTASVVSGDLKYDPNTNFNGNDEFTYKASDGTAASAAATVDVTVNAVNDAPEATDDSATTAEDTPKSINVLSNDSDVDGDSLSVSGVG
ncbi:MAG: cadherin-like domain-containing protein, partial [Chloroflexota bacterium]|nr:cadherin-like domain-containing protein [Chloroflexota bacterium]